MQLMDWPRVGADSIVAGTCELHDRTDSMLDLTPAKDGIAGAQASAIDIPIVLILGPPGCGKGTLSKKLAQDYKLHHFSTGDWLRAQSHPPIAGVSKRINRYVYADEVVPEAVLTAEYSRQEDVPPPLLLYNCSKRGVSTPSEMWLRALPALKDEFQRIAQSSLPDRPTAILLDNFPKTITHARAAAEIFGSGFPALAISVTCSEDTARSRFLGRGRGSDDADVFARRFARSARETPAVIKYYDSTSCVVRIDAAGGSYEVYDTLVAALGECSVWSEMFAESAGESSVESLQECSGGH